VGWNLIPSLANVHLDHSLGVDREPLVGVDNNTEKARVGVDELGLKTDLQVVEDRGIIEVGQVSHVLTFLKLGRVDLANLSRWEHFFLVATHDNGLCAIIALKETLPETMIIGGDPDRLLRVIGLEHVLALHLEGDDQVRCWIRIGLSGLAELDVTRHVELETLILFDLND